MVDLSLLNNLDPDLVDKIYNYITYTQNTNLLEDIKSFHDVKDTLYRLYSERYSHEPEEIENWIYNDIILFYNNEMPLMNGYTKEYIDKLNRDICKHSDEKVKKYIMYCDNNKNIKSLINIHISKLSVEERFELLHFVNTF